MTENAPAKRATPVAAAVRRRLQSALVQDLLTWFESDARELPWRRTTDPYAIWISEIMLQQTQVSTVIPYWTRWMERFPDVRSLATARLEEILKLWEGLGYYARARNAHAAAQAIVQKFGGRFPTTFDDVLALPGIGRYTAGAVCSIAFNQPNPILDGNAARVLSRIFGIRGDPREKAANARLWTLAQELVDAANALLLNPNPNPNHNPNHSLGDLRKGRPSRPSAPQAAHRPCSALNQAIMELGALICAPSQPQCPRCPVRRRCFAHAAGKVEEFPSRRKSPRPTRRRFIAFIVQKENRYLVRQRPAGVVNAHFWEFPNVEIGPSCAVGANQVLVGSPRRGDLGRLGEPSLPPMEITLSKLELRPFTDLKGFAPFVLTCETPLCRVIHAITRYRIELSAYSAELQPEAAHRDGLGVWRSPEQMSRMPFASAHRRILRLLPASNPESASNAGNRRQNQRPSKPI